MMKKNRTLFHTYITRHRRWDTRDYGYNILLHTKEPAGPREAGRLKRVVSVKQCSGKGTC